MLLNQIIYQMICEGDSGISNANLLSIVLKAKCFLVAQKGVI